ncbi:MAG TPA: hypothetical protein VG709_05885, partial [Actinomycetota bacterium]|nr:hypothetical protein [Actinomycetota bacterium]
PSALATATTRQLTPGSDTYRFRTRAVDKAGNMSRFAVGPAFRITAFDDSHAAIVDKGTWTTVALTGAYGGAVQHSSAAGTTATLSVPPGTKNVAWVTTRGPDRGRARVCIDPGPASASCTTVDLYASPTALRRVVFARPVSPAAAHKVEVTVLGQKNASSTGTRVDVDAFLTTT